MRVRGERGFRVMKSLVVGPVLVALLAAACATETTPAPPVDGDDEIVDVEDVGDVPGFDGEGREEGAAVRRMTIRELDASIRVAAGADETGEQIFWNALAGVKITAFDDRAFGPALGKPDWVSVTGESPAPSPLYTKFAQDMSRDVCVQMVAADTNRAAGEEMTVFRHAPIDADPTSEEKEANIRYLLLRFLGLTDAEAQPRCHALDELYETVHQAATTAGAPAPWVNAWSVVCIALFEDPAFHLH